MNVVIVGLSDNCVNGASVLLSDSHTPVSRKGTRMEQSLAADELRDQLDAQGYLIVEDVLDPENVIDPVLDAFAARISEFALRERRTRSYAQLDLAGQLSSWRRARTGWTPD